MSDFAKNTTSKEHLLVHQGSQKNLFAVAGVISSVIGILWAIPSYLQESHLAASLFSLLLVVGIVLLALAFGEEDGRAMHH